MLTIAKALRNRRGQTFVEFAFVFVIVIAFVILLMEVGRLAYAWSALHFSANRALRETRNTNSAATIRNAFISNAAQLGVQVNPNDVFVMTFFGVNSMRVNARVPMLAVPEMFTQWIGDHSGGYRVRFWEVISRNVAITSN